jgi:hypothetical protein
MSNTIFAADSLAGVYEDPRTGLRQCLGILGATDQVAYLSNNTTIAHTQHRGPCAAVDIASHGNVGGSIYAVKAVRLKATPGAAGASYNPSKISTVPGTSAASQVTAGTFYSPP